MVIEEYLDGPEVSLFAITDGTTVYPLQPAQDFKRIHDGDEGPNTGGMGAYTPLPWAPPGLVDEVLATVLQPTVDELARRGTPFAGLLYAGLALTSRGVRVVEFNARFGDPETQPLLALLESPLGELLMAAATGDLAYVPAPVFADGAAVGVVLASRGYPASSSSGDVITGIDAAESLPGVHVIQAGTALRDGPEGDELVTAGGRVLAVVGTGPDLTAARAAAYAGVARDLLRRCPAPHRHRGGPVTFAPGATITVREVWDGSAWLEHPVLVESDEGADGVLAVVLADGSQFTFPPAPRRSAPVEQQRPLAGGHRTPAATTASTGTRSGSSSRPVASSSAGTSTSSGRSFARLRASTPTTSSSTWWSCPTASVAGRTSSTSRAGSTSAGSASTTSWPCSGRPPMSPTCSTATSAGGRRGTTGARLSPEPRFAVQSRAATSSWTMLTKVREFAS